MYNEPQKQNNFINVLKGIGAILVITTHFSWTDAERTMFLFPFFIEMAVPLFMIISGYVYGLSYRRNNITSLRAAYAPFTIVKRIVQYTFPFILVYSLELVYMLVIGQITITSENWLHWVSVFFQGGIGPGSYYFPIMIQFIFVYPILYFIIKKANGKGLLICFFINAAYEILQRACGMDAELYRLLLFRYIFVISAGCYLASEGAKIQLKTGILLCLAGIAYIVAITYCGYTPRILIHWKGTSFVACLYLIPIFYLLITKIRNCTFKPLEIVGKASYNIFLTQMVWYALGSWYVEKFIDNRFVLLGIHILVCVGVGLVFYFVETPITKWINKKLLTTYNPTRT